MNSSLNRGAGGGGGGGGTGGREVFLSAHRCPEVDFVSYQTCETGIAPPCSLVPAEIGPTEENYLKISFACQSEEEQQEEKEESISDWSEEDLSLHFSPSVILSSEESDPESSFECVDIAMETQMKGREGVGLKMVPKRQIQLKKKKDDEKVQVSLNDVPVKGGGAYREVSANQQCDTTVSQRPDMLQRQHSLPASLHTRSNTCGDDGYKVHSGQFTGAGQGLQGGNARQLLQKSFSLDETKTKMASCIITSVLSKKMQVEQQVKPPVVRPPVHQGGQKALVHVVRDVRSLVKNTCSLSFSAATSPPPSCLQAVGGKGHDERRKSYRGHVAKVAAALSQSQDGKLGNTVTCPVKHHDVTLIDPPNDSHLRLPLAPPLQMWSRADRNQRGDNTGTPATQLQEQQGNHQQQIVQGLLPAQMGGDITGASAAPMAVLNGPAPCHVIIEPQSGRCFYMDMPRQRKLLLDPETGQYVQVFLPAAGPVPSGVFPLSHPNPAPMFLNTTPIIINPTPTVLSVMQLQPTVAVTPLYAAPCPPHTLKFP